MLQNALRTIFDERAFPLPHIQQLETELSLFSKCLLDGKAYEWLSSWLFRWNERDRDGTLREP